MTTSSQINNIKTFIRMDQWFIDNILSHVNHSVPKPDSHYIYCVFSPKTIREHEVVRNWIEAQDASCQVKSYLTENSKNPGTVVGMSLSQLTYKQLDVLNEQSCHSVIKLPSQRQGVETIPTNNPLLHRVAGKAYLYFVRNRDLEAKAF